MLDSMALDVNQLVFVCPRWVSYVLVRGARCMCAVCAKLLASCQQETEGPQFPIFDHHPGLWWVIGHRMGQAELQCPQFALTCSSFSSVLVEHQALPSGSSAVVHAVNLRPW